MNNMPSTGSIGTVERKLPGSARRWEVTRDRAARAAPFREHWTGPVHPEHRTRIETVERKLPGET
jgi:hypothetical protein